MIAFRRLAALAAALIFVQIVLGALVRLSGSGLACPDWPLCYGLWFPTPGLLAALPGVDYAFWQVMAEWAHRFNAAALVAPAVLAMTAIAWRRRAEAPVAARISAVALLVLLVQAGLGGLTVLDRNSPWSVATHLTVALLLLALVLHAPRCGRAAPRLHGAAAAAALAVAAAAASGAMTAKAGATTVCPDWPLCDGSLFPALDDPLTRLHMAHRALALAAAALIVFAWARARGGGAHRLMNLALAAAAAQIALGALVPRIFAGAALWPQVAVGATHQALAVALFVCLVAAAPRESSRESACG